MIKEALYLFTFCFVLEAAALLQFLLVPFWVSFGCQAITLISSITVVVSIYIVAIYVVKRSKNVILINL